MFESVRTAKRTYSLSSASSAVCFDSNVLCLKWLLLVDRTFASQTLRNKRIASDAFSGSLCPVQFTIAISAGNSFAPDRHESIFADEETCGAVASKRLHILARH